MYGIVTIVEGAAGAHVERAWEALRTKHGPEATRGHNLPHVSYHVADDYDLAAVERLFDRISREVTPFDALIRGLSTLSHEETRLVYLSVVRSPALAALQDTLWDDATSAGTGVIDHYRRDVWFPHVTLGDNPLVLDAIPELARILEAEPRPESFRVDNLALIEEMPYGHETRLRVSLGAGTA